MVPQYETKTFFVNKPRSMRRLGRNAGVKCRLEGMRARQLAGNDLHARLQRANRARDTACKPAATEGNQDGLDVGRLCQDLEPDRGVAGQGGPVPHGIDVDTLLTVERARLDRAPPFGARTQCDACSQASQLLEL